MEVDKSEVEGAPTIPFEAGSTDTLQDFEFPGGHSQLPAGSEHLEFSQKPQHAYVHVKGTFVETPSEEEQADGRKPVRTSSTSKEVGVKQQPHSIVEKDFKPFSKNIHSKIGGSQDIAVGYDDRTFKKACFIKEVIVGPDFGRRPEAEFEVFPIKIRLKSGPKMLSLFRHAFLQVRLS